MSIRKKTYSFSPLVYRIIVAFAIICPSAIFDMNSTTFFLHSNHSKFRAIITDAMSISYERRP